MSPIRAAIIGAGRPRRTQGATGFGMAHFHAGGFVNAPDTQLVAVSDIKPENAEAFAKDYAGVAPYTSTLEMIEKAKPDIVSICLWDHLHHPVTMECLRAGIKAIHCEKPMAPTMGDSRRMVEETDKAGAQLTFNHEMRFSLATSEMKRLLDAGEIGDLVRIEGACENLLDAGTHYIDLMFMFNNETPAEWVIGQIDSRTDRAIFGIPHEDQSLTQFHFKNGIDALFVTGKDAAVSIGCKLRLVGSRGIIEWGVEPVTPRPVRILRYDRPGGWQESPVEEQMGGPDLLVKATARGVADAVESLRSGKRSKLDCHWALQTTEIIFGTYESCRRRGRVDLPLLIEDSPFLAMKEAGLIGPKK